MLIPNELLDEFCNFMNSYFGVVPTITDKRNKKEEVRAKMFYRDEVVFVIKAGDVENPNNLAVRCRNDKVLEEIEKAWSIYIIENLKEDDNGN